MWWCGCAGFGQRYLAGVVDSRLVGAGAREPAGSRLRFLVLGYVIWLVWLCGFAGLRVRGFAGSRLRYPAGVVVRVRGVRAALSGWCGR